MDAFRVTAPTRADLAGGTLDLWPLYCLVGESKTINVALDKRLSVQFEVVPATKFGVEIQSEEGHTASFSQPMRKNEINTFLPSLRFPLLIASEYISRHSLLPERLVRIRPKSEVPVGSGLGGSSSLCVALVRGLANIFGEFATQGWQWDVLRWAMDVEASYLRVPTGSQDYLAALFGGLHCFTSRNGGIDLEPYPEGVFDELSERLFVLFSGEMHDSGLSNWEIYRGAVQGEENTLRGLEKIRGIAGQLDSELRSGRLSWKHIGACLDEEWKVRRSVFKVQTKRLEEIIQFLASRRVYGAKVCGAAAGGSVLALIDPTLREGLTHACAQSGITVLPCRGSPTGVTILPV